MADTYYAKVNHLARFLTREDERGYTFAVAQDQRMIPAINQELSEISAFKANLPLGVLRLDKEKNLIPQLEAALENRQGLLVMGLDSWIEDEQKLLYLNFSREDLLKLERPLVFWVNQSSLAHLANGAIDLFSQRRTTTVFFESSQEFEVPDSGLEKRLNPQHFSEEERSERTISLNLKKKQLQEALEAKLNPSRIALQYALPLVKAYAELDLADEAMELFYQYLAELEEEITSEQKLDFARICEAGRDYERAKKYLLSIIAATPLEEADEETLRNRSAALSNLGDLHAYLGELSAARLYYEEDLELSQKLAERNPQSEQLQRDLAIAIAKLADLETTLGLLDAARERYEQRIELSQKLAERNPQSEQLQRDLAIAIAKLADLETTLGLLDAARERYEQSIELSQKLAERNPQSEQLQRDFSVACYKLALMYEQLEDAAGAEKYFIKDMEIAEKLWRDNPRNVGLGEDLLVTYQGFAKRMAQQGDRATCITYLERAIQVCQDLFACAARETYQSQLQALQEELVQVQGLK